nr:hypothetical protein [Pandoravirus massiliensis]
MSTRNGGVDGQVVDRAVARLIDAGVHVIDLTDLYALGVSLAVTTLDLLRSIERVGESRSVEIAGPATCGGQRFVIERIDPETTDLTARFDDAVRRLLEARITCIQAGSIPQRYYPRGMERHDMIDQFDRAIFDHCRALGCRVTGVLEMIPPIYQIAYDGPTRRARRETVSATATDDGDDHDTGACDD